MRFFLLLFLLAACLPETSSKKTNKSSNLKAEGQEGAAGFQEEEEEEPALIDAFDLHIYSPVVSTLQEQSGSLSSFVRFNASGETDYIEYEICPLEVQDENSSCESSLTPELGFIIPALFAGRVEITLRPCVSPDRSFRNENCGESKSLVYDSHRVSLEVAKLLRQKIIYEEQASALILEHKDYLASWLEQSKACAAQNAEAEEQLSRSIMIVEEFIKGPIEYFPRLIFTNEAVYENFTKPLADWMDDFKDSVVQSCKEDDQTEEDSICEMAGGLVGLISGIAEGMTNPLPAISYSIASINKLTDPESSISLACNQEDKLSTAHFQYESRKTLLVTNYNRVIERLDELGVPYD